MTAPKDPAPARSATRAPIDRPVRLQFEDGSEVVEGRSHDVSIGGMFVGEVGTRERGTQVRFELILDEENSIRGLAEVVWSQSSPSAGRQAGVGLRFRFLEQRDRQQIFRLVSEHIKERLAREGPAASSPAPSLFDEPEEESAEDRAVSAGVDVPPAQAPPASEAPSRDEGATSGPLFGSGPESPPEGPQTPREVGIPPEPFPEIPGPSEPAVATAPVGESRSRKSGLAKVAIPLVVGLLAVGGWFLFRSGEATPTAPASAEGGAAAVSETPTTSEPSAPRAAEPVDAGGSENVESESVPPPPAVEPVAPPAAPPRSAPPPPPPQRAAEGGDEFRRLLDVRWRTDGADTILVLETDGRVEEGRFKYFRIGGDKPREVVRLLGAAEPFARGEEEAPEVAAVSRVRFGYHRKPEGNELHVVLDLADPAWKLAEVVARGNRLEGVLRKD